MGKNVGDEEFEPEQTLDLNAEEPKVIQEEL